MQALPLDRKIQITQARIIEWYQHYNGNVCVSFSGGKDSTVLLHIARQIYPNIPAVFSNTGLEYSSIQRFVKTWDNVDIVVPKMRFDQVISTYGYPLIGKEVAEAIYYARRLRSQTGNVERERERERASENAPNLWESEQREAVGSEDSQVKANAIGEVTTPPHTHTRRRTELAGQVEFQPRKCWRQTADGTTYAANRMEETGNWGGEQPTYPDKHSAKQTDSSQRTDGRGSWQSYDATKRVRWILSGFRNTAGVVEPKSQFNKEKWLPLVYTPFLISHMCCHKMKKAPMHRYQSERKYKPILATLAEESRIRKQAWIRHGCNAFDSGNPMSQPMSFWTEQDVLAYIVRYNLPIASVYGDIVSVGKDGCEYPPTDLIGNPLCGLKCTGCQRTGCVYCGFGFHLEKKGKTRFQILAEVEPRKYEFSIGGGQWVDNPHYDATAPEYDGEWKNWNPKQIWAPSKKGLGLGKVFDMVNEIYGKNFYRYE